MPKHNKPLAILSSLTMTDGKNLCDLRTIYNARLNRRIEHLAERSPMDGLRDNVKEGKITYHVKANDYGFIADLFCTFGECNTSKQYNHDLMMDNAHNTNQFRLALLHMIVMTAFSATFTVAFCILAMERIENIYGQR